MKVYFTNTGCSAENEDFLRFIRFINAEQTPNILEADIIIVHFCAMCTENFESIPPHMAVLQGMKTINPKIKIYVGGCAAEIIDFQKRYSFIDGVFNRRRMVEDLSNYFNYNPESDNLPISYYNCVRIQSGCSRHCVFCKKAYLNMPLCSKPIPKVIQDIMDAVSNGYHDIVLHAENSTEYGLDLPGHVRLIDLLKAVVAIDDVKSIYISALCIDELALDSELVSYIRDCPKITKVQLEIQSLIPEVRKNMCLTSNVDDVLRILSEFSNKYIVTNIMVGYPGETLENFKQELELVERYGLYFVQLNTYTDTPLVYGHSLKQISESDVQARTHMMINSILKLRIKKANDIIDISKKNAIQCVYTTENRLEILGESAIVNVGNGQKFLSGQIVNVKVTGVDKLFDMFDHDQTMCLRGKII